MARDRHAASRLDRQARAALTHLHDLPYLQMHPIAGLRGQDLRHELLAAIAGMGSARSAELLRLRYGEALESREVAARLAISQGHYYREHQRAVAALASVLCTRAPQRPGESTVGALASAPAVHAVLRPTTSFVGRAREMADGERLLAEAQLVTITGAGGSGKTRLALQIAARVRARFEQFGVVELAALAVPRNADEPATRDGIAASRGEPATLPVARAIAAALGATEREGTDLTESIARLSRGRPTLVVLDNCEHLLGACAELLQQLLPASPDLRVLATSRAPLRLYDERELTLTPVPPDHEGVQLFLDRARQRRSAFAPHDAELAAIVEVCRRLDGLPLAIELAAARIRLEPPRVLLAALRDAGGLLELSGAARDLHARHRTLRGTIAWSYDLLDSADQRLFRRLSVFDGSFSVESAAAVGELGSEAFDRVASLVDQSLVAAAEPAGTQGRFAILETIREYARERLVESGELEDSRRRMAEHFVAVAEAAHHGLRGPDQLEWTARLRRDLDNLRAVLRWAIEGGEAQMALQIVGCYVRRWDGIGLAVEAIEWQHRVLSMPGAQARTLPRARALLAHGPLARAARHWSDAELSCAEALEIATDLHEPTFAAIPSNFLSIISASRGDRSAARRHGEQGLRFARASNDAVSASLSLLELAGFDVDEADYTSAVRRLAEARAITWTTGDRNLTQRWHHLMGAVAYGQRDLPRARDNFEEALAISLELGNPLFSGDMRRELAIVYSDEGDQAAARSLLRAAFADCQRIGYLNGVAASLAALAGVLAAEGAAAPALRVAGAAASLRARVGAIHTLHTAARLERRLAPARAALDEATAAAAYAAGEQLDLDQAAAEALAL